jgi:hypothetical protein
MPTKKAGESPSHLLSGWRTAGKTPTAAGQAYAAEGNGKGDGKMSALRKQHLRV